MLLACSSDSDEQGTTETDVRTDVDRSADGSADSGAAAMDVAQDDANEPSPDADSAEPDITSMDTMTADASLLDAADDVSTTDTSGSGTPDVVEVDVAVDTASATTATIVGALLRTTEPARGNDGAGDVFIALFDSDPISNRTQSPQGAVIIAAVDLSFDGASVAYQFPNVVPRPEPYFISAFMDDNGNASTSPESAGPDRGDLVMLQSFLPPASKQITVTEPGEFVFDIELDQILPF
jgi:phage-related tail fiber protein